MTEYHKIQSVFLRDPKTKRFVEGQWSTPELAYLHDKQWVWDEKIDGTNIRVEWDGVKRVFKGRTDNAQIPAHLYARLEELFDAELLSRTFPAEMGVASDTPMVLHGEGFGAKIQKGGAYLGDKVDFILFDVRVGRWWLTRDAVERIASNLGCMVTPIVGEGTITEAIEYTRGGFKSQFGTADAEGLILRPKVPLFARSGERIITKVKTVDFR